MLIAFWRHQNCKRAERLATDIRGCVGSGNHLFACTATITSLIPIQMRHGNIDRTTATTLTITITHDTCSQAVYIMYASISKWLHKQRLLLRMCHNQCHLFRRTALRCSSHVNRSLSRLPAVRDNVGRHHSAAYLGVGRTQLQHW